ncbi:putative ribonuclease toxin of YeeF-YezG toxin-antitoxin module [Scopulibacillus darangshiensis]|uniref:Putative ribonuclease toxin of YeeF-YezG toxin-antitoxin module n=1 Tax=Scopulibacillus darangshiensis TaxID=442528 RepID=A0A4R2PBF0_9BACL|nr:T7SS effector LXG polymorphic toxin [Scopulibacillus darangshiensis]TCP31225.1 putative ribonuclease toxin of YeeF-YezG toxin-antitoxin module [Scopulibacillus darangshiensis]
MKAATGGGGGTSAHKVYDAKALVAAMKERHGHYETLQGELKSLRNAMLDMTKLDDALQGKGADAIKGFYHAQVDVVDAWLDFIKVQLAFFKSVSAATEDKDLGGNTVVDLDFLIEDLYRSDTRAKDIVEGQKEDLQKIFDGIQDILSLEVFDSGEFEDKIGEAEKERHNTIEKVTTLDSELTDEYGLSETEQNYVGALYGALINATSQNGKISPLNFNAKAYHSSDIYKLKDKVEKNTKDYLTFKDKQEEARRLKKKQEEMENRPWYEKTWDTVCNFTGEVSGYYDYKRASEGIDPVTGRKLSNAERITAGAMAAAGFIPIIGWAGRALKGGRAIYKTAKGLRAADHMLDAYKTSKSLDILRKSEMGIYGLVTANGFGEAMTGKDMFGNKLTDEQRKNSAISAFTMLGIGGAARAVDKYGAKLPYSKHYAATKVAEAKKSMQALKHKVGRFEVPTRIRSEAMATPTGHTFKMYHVEKQTLSKVKNNLAARRADDVSGGGSRSVGGTGEGITKVKYGDHFTKINRKKALKPNVEYTSKEGYTYRTDDEGRITSCKGKLVLGNGKRSGYFQKKVGGVFRKSGDDGGHLIATIFKGSGGLDNLVPMDANLNRGAYKSLENTWGKALSAGDNVDISVKPIYKGDSLRPVKFEIKYKIGNDDPIKVKLRNQPGG